MITKNQIRQKLAHKQMRKQAAAKKIGSCALVLLKARALEKEASALSQAFVNAWQAHRQNNGG